MNKWTSHLNPEQTEAALHDTGPLLILAGAGSGKTTVLVSRTGRMIEERVAHASEICVLTFTNKAARELKHRVEQKLGSAGDKIWAGTFHSFGLQILRRYHKAAELPKSFGLLDQGDTSALIKDLLRSFHLSGKAAFDADRLLGQLSRWRESGKKSSDTEDPYDIATEWLLPKYLAKMRALGVVDFDGLILKPLELLENHAEVREQIPATFKHVMVDEFQDTNDSQMRLVRALVEPHKNVTVVGDDDQSIYGWRGAQIRNILDFPKLYRGCKVVRLERNYRSTPSIINVANAIISKNEHRHGKVLKPDPTKRTGTKPEVFVFENEDQETEFVAREIARVTQAGRAHHDIGVLYRSNSQGALLEMELRRSLIPYSLAGGTAFFDRRETKDILAFLRCALTPHEVALRRIINVPHRGIGDVSVERITEFAEQNRIPFITAARRHAEFEIPATAHEGIDQLFTFLDGLPDAILNGSPEQADQRLIAQMESIGYRSYLKQSEAKAEAAEHRWRVVEIFAGVLNRFLLKGGMTRKSIREFVDAMLLRDQEEQSNDDGPKSKVQLMTFHSCKGLEFPVVMLVGIEEEIIPHRTLGLDISEERRLFYVAATRARESLMMTRVKLRKKFGRLQAAVPSRFLLEIPVDLLQIHENGFRPVNESERKSLMADVFKRIEANKKEVL